MQHRDEQLMRDLQSGELDAMQEIFKNNKGRILNFCFGLLGNRADAEDVAGEVFLAVMKYKQYYNPERTFSTWLFTIARNQCFNHLRSRKRTASLWSNAPGHDQRESWDVPDDRDHSREILAKQERALQIRQAIDKLPYQQKEALLLKQYQGFSYAEISQILQCSLAQVKILIFRAKQQLRNDLASFIREGIQ